MPPPTVFVSYSRKDENEKNQLLDHLNVLQGIGLVEVWSDDRISGGADWESKIRQAMAQAKVAILLITKHFLTSDFILEKEVPKLLTRRESEDLIVFPVIAKPCAWGTVDWLKKMNVRPKNGACVWRSGGDYADEELAAIAEEIAEIIEKANADSKRTLFLKILSKEAQTALDLCIERRRIQVRNTLPPDFHDFAYKQVDAIKQAFLTDPLDTSQIRSVLEFSRTIPDLLDQMKILLQEPTLQRLVRRSGEDAVQTYEHLVFSLDD